MLHLMSYMSIHVMVVIQHRVVYDNNDIILVYIKRKPYAMV